MEDHEKNQMQILSRSDSRFLSHRKHMTHLCFRTELRKINTTENTNNTCTGKQYSQTVRFIKHRHLCWVILGQDAVHSSLHPFSLPSPSLSPHPSIIIWSSALKRRVIYCTAQFSHVWVWASVWEAFPLGARYVLIVCLHILVCLCACPWPKLITMLIIKD